MNFFERLARLLGLISDSKPDPEPDLEEEPKLLIFGTEDGRCLQKNTVASSSVRFRCRDDGHLEECTQAIRDFSVVLRTRKPSDVKYGWDKVFVDYKTRIVTFRILWYDKPFFERRSQAYKSSFHKDVFERLQLTSKDLTVQSQVHDVLPEG